MWKTKEKFIIEVDFRNNKLVVQEDFMGYTKTIREFHGQEAVNFYNNNIFGEVVYNEQCRDKM